MSAERLSSSDSNLWGNRAVYQIYPRSFNNEPDKQGFSSGEGNFRGMTAKIEYLDELGVGAIWVSPFYPSPMVDGGYDVADYRDVDSRYGNLADAQEFIDVAHEHDKKVIIDLVANHTSNQHPWFLESRSSRDNPYADYYIWRDPNPDGTPPNNWGSVFSLPQLRARQNGEMPWLRDDESTPPISAWKFDETRGQYYLHTFADEQPDLNWENPQVREEIKDVMRFWLNLDVDGFRVDAANHMAKNPELPDEAPNPDYIEGVMNPYDKNVRFQSADYPGTLVPYLSEMISVLDEYPDRDIHIVFEAYVAPETLDIINTISPKNAGAFAFSRFDADWNAAEHKAHLDYQYAHLRPGATTTQVNGNHDKPRLASRVGDKNARTAALINLTLPRCNPYIYMGEEGGLHDVDIPPERRDDALGFRDGCRTPMQWSSDKNAGFSQANPGDLWLPISPHYETENIENQRNDPRSSFSLYRTLLHMRKATPALCDGQYVSLGTDIPQSALAYAARTGRKQISVFANFTEREITGRMLGAQQGIGRVVVSSIFGSAGREVTPEDGIVLAPHESIVIVGSA